MPGRFVTALILLFWVAMAAWFILRDAWPRLDPEEPPRLTVDLVDEGGGANRIARSIGTHWTVDQTPVNGEKVRYFMESLTTYDPNSDIFSLIAELQGKSLDLKLNSTYRMDRDGNIHALEVVVEHYRQRVLPDGKRDQVLERGDEFSFDIRDRHATLTRTAFNETQRQEKVVIDLGDVCLPHSGLIQSPLHPTYRLERFLPGRSWRVPFFDPLGTSNGTVQPCLTWLDARVRHDRDNLQVTRESRSKSVACVVCDLTGDGVQGTIWQDAENGEMLRQEWTIRGERWLIQQSRDIPVLRHEPTLGQP